MLKILNLKLENDYNDSLNDDDWKNNKFLDIEGQSCPLFTYVGL